MRRKPRCTKIKYKSKAGARRSLRHSKLSHKMRAYRCDRCGLYHLTKEGRQFDEQQRSDYDAGPERIERERSAME